MIYRVSGRFASSPPHHSRFESLDLLFIKFGHLLISTTSIDIDFASENDPCDQPVGIIGGFQRVMIYRCSGRY